VPGCPLETEAPERLHREAEAALRDLAFILLLAERVREEIRAPRPTPAC
jgi:hypothetical protein